MTTESVSHPSSSTLENLDRIDRQIKADELLARKLQAEFQQPLEPPNEPPAKLQELYSQLRNLTQYKGEKNESDVWAEDYGIRLALEKYIGPYVHIIDPKLSSIFSPFDPAFSMQGIINYVKAITGFRSETRQAVTEGILKQDGGSLKKPIVMIINTQSAKAKSKSDATAIGGYHWVVCVILPKNYKTPFGKAFSNVLEKIIFVDSLPNNVDAKNFMFAFTKEHEEKIIADQNVQAQQIIPAAFNNAETQTYEGIPLQKAGYDCRWWAVYNAIMIVLEGNLDFLNQFNSPSREPAYALRYLLGDLSQQEKIASIINEKDNTKEIEVNLKRYMDLTSYKPPSKEWRHAKFVTNIIAAIAVALGSFLAFAGSIFSSQGLSLGLVIPGLMTLGAGIAPRLLVELFSTLEISNKEINTKNFLTTKIDQLRLESKIKETLTAKHKLNSKNKGKWIDFSVKAFAMLFAYATAITLSVLLLLEKNTTDKDKKMDYLSMRFILTGLSALMTLGLTLTSLVLENIAEKRQKKIDAEVQALDAELEIKKIESIVSSSQEGIFRRLGMTAEQAGIMLTVAAQDKLVIRKSKYSPESIPLEGAQAATINKTDDEKKPKEKKKDLEHGHTHSHKKGI